MKKLKHFIIFLLFIPLVDTSAQSLIDLKLIGRYETGIFDNAATEISAYDKSSKRLFSVNGSTGNIDIIDLSNPSNPQFITTISLLPYGGQANSVAIYNGLVAAAVENVNKQLNGKVVFFDKWGNFIKWVEVGALPDMITFTPDGKKIVVANEGEPSDDYSVDPLGTVSIIDINGNINSVSQSKVTTLDFTAYNNMPIDPQIRIFGPGASVAQDLEPEYVAITADARTAIVVLQENNAIAFIDLKTKEITGLKALGFKNHNLPGNGIDASDQNGGNINITTWPVWGMYQPDAMESFRINGQDFLIMANEGDARDYSGYSEVKRLNSQVLDSVAFPDAAVLLNNNNVGRINITTATGDIDGDDDLDEIYVYGSRSISIRDDQGNLIWDSGDFLEQKIYELLPDYFNVSSTNNNKKNRSDDKGPEPEGLTVAKILDSTYVFVGLERVGGIMVFNISDPYQPYYVQYINTRNFNEIPGPGTGGDLGPEGILFIPLQESPTGKNLLIVSNEISGSIAMFEVDHLCGTNKVEICWNGNTQCVNYSQLEKYIQQGAVLGSCNPIRMQAHDFETISGFNVFPNPASTEMSVAFELAKEKKVSLKLLDVYGKIIYEMPEQIYPEGRNSITFLTNTFEGIKIAPGLYNISLTTQSEEFTRQIVIIK